MGLFSCLLDALFENVDGDVGFFLGDDQRRRMRIVLGPQPRKRTPCSKASSTMRSRSAAAYSLVCLILYDFDADHEAAAAHVADQLVLLEANRPCASTCERRLRRSSREVFSFDYVQCGQGCGDANGIAAEGGGVRTRAPSP